MEKLKQGFYKGTLEAEAASWCIEDDDQRREKIQRERIRHFKLIEDLLLDQLDTHLMQVLEVGGGPCPVSDLLNCRRRVVVDPLASQYAEFFPVPDHVELQAEDMDFGSEFDLVICTNALDHVEDPEVAMERMDIALKPGGFMAVLCAENNALTNPHPAHVHNLTADRVEAALRQDYELVRRRTYREDGYRYGWVEWEGQRGQPAFALLMRKCVGYSA